MVTWLSAGEPVQPTYCSSPKLLTTIGLSRVPASWNRVSLSSLRELSPTWSQLAADRMVLGFSRTVSAGVQRLHVKDVYALHFAQDFQTLKTSRLLKIGRNGAGLCSWRYEIVLALDLCACVLAAEASSAPYLAGCSPWSGVISLESWPGLGLPSRDSTVNC